jgi:hypothetical protein
MKVKNKYHVVATLVYFNGTCDDIDRDTQAISEAKAIQNCAFKNGKVVGYVRNAKAICLGPVGQVKGQLSLI